MIQSVTKALRLLQALDFQSDWIGVRELSRRVHLSPPSVHNLLKTLVAAGFVETNPETRQYRLGLAATRLGAGADPLNTMRLFARPYIEKLAAEFDETIAVLAWQHGEAVVVDWIQADHPLAVTHNRGRIEHPIIFASGRVLLAHQDEATRLRYCQTEDFAELGLTHPRNTDEYLALLNKIVREGHAITENVANTGVIAIGAPVFDGKGRLLMAIGCSAPLSRTTQDQLLQVKERLFSLTGEMTKKLNGIDPKADGSLVIKAG